MRILVISKDREDATIAGVEYSDVESFEVELYPGETQVLEMYPGAPVEHKLEKGDMVYVDGMLVYER